MKTLISNKKGFTLVELMIAILIMGVLLTVCYQFFSSTWKASNSVENVNEYQSLLNDSMYRIRVELADATSVTAFDRPGDFDESTYTFDDGYVYIISDLYSGYSIYYKDDSGVLQKQHVANFDSDVTAKLKTLDLAAATGSTDAVEEYNNALANAGYRIAVKFEVIDAGRTTVTTEVCKGTNSIKALSSDIVLRSAVSSGTGNSIKFKVD